MAAYWHKGHARELGVGLLTGCGLDLGNEEGGRVEVRGEFVAGEFRVGTHALKRCLALRDVAFGIFRKGTKRQCLGGERGWYCKRGGAAEQTEAPLTLEVFLVARGKYLPHDFVIASKRLVGSLRDALGEGTKREDAEERITTAEVGIEEAERLARLDGFDPESDAGELDGHGVAVYAVDAEPDDVAEGAT